MTNLEQLSKILDDKGFDTSVADGILAGSKENPDYSVEITIDSGGGCLVKKIVMGKQSSNRILFKNQKIPKIDFSSKTSQIRVKINSNEDLIDLIKIISIPRF